MSCSQSAASPLCTASTTDVKWVSRFFPLMTSVGSLVVEGQVMDAKGDGMFIHAIQCMRPDSVSA